MYEEHTLPSGETITITSDGDHPRKPWQVCCWAAGDEGECRWTKDFVTEAEARTEYVRFG